MSPGVHTEEFLVSLQGLMRVWGGLAVAGLAVAAHLFDAACLQHLGFSLNSIMLVMITGYITTALRQVCETCPPLFAVTPLMEWLNNRLFVSAAQAQSLMQMPRLARALARERAVLSQLVPASPAHA